MNARAIGLMLKARRIFIVGSGASHYVGAFLEDGLALYLDAEKHDGYQRDRSVFDRGITTEDNLTAIVDEADSVLVDEALIPLVLAGSTEAEVPDQAIHEVVGRLKNKHYDIDAEGRNVTLTDEGAAFVEEELGGIDLYDEEHVGTTLVHVNIAMHAYYLLDRDVHYIVRDGGVHLINASRGRVAQLQPVARSDRPVRVEHRQTRGAVDIQAQQHRRAAPRAGQQREDDSESQDARR